MCVGAQELDNIGMFEVVENRKVFQFLLMVLFYLEFFPSKLGNVSDE